MSLRANTFTHRASAALMVEHVSGFGLRLLLLVIALVGVPWMVSLAHLPGLAAYAVPAAAALILAVAYTWFPAEGLFAFALYVAFYDSIALHLGPRIRQVDELGLLVLFPLALMRVWREWRSWVWWPRDAALGGVVGIGLVSSLIAGVPIGTWAPALALLLKPMGFLYIVTWTPFRVSQIRSMLVIGVGIGVTVSLLGFVELISPVAFQHFFGLNEYLRFRNESAVVKSLFVHPGLFGFFTAFFALWAYAYYLTTRHWRWLVAALILSVGPFLSARRRAILAMGAGLLTAFGEQFRILRDKVVLLRTWVPVALGAGVLVVFFMPGLFGLYEMTVNRYVDSSWPSPVAGSNTRAAQAHIAEDTQARVALYVGSVEIARDYFPLGGGLGRYGTWMSRVNYSPLYREYGLSHVRGLRPRASAAATDTFWPAVLGELGVAGLLAYITFLGALGVLLWREAKRSDGPVMRIIRLAAGMVLVQAIAESFASPMFNSPPRVYLTFLAVGIVVSIAWRRRAVERE